MNTRKGFETITDVISNLSWLSSLKIFSKIISLVSAIYLARVLDREGFGIYSYALAILPFFQAFTSEGFRVAGVQLIVSNKEDGSNSSMLELSFKILLLRFAFSVIAYLFILLFIEFTSKSNTQYVFLSLIFLLIILYSFDVQWILQGLEKMKIIGISDLTKQVLFLILVISFIKNSKDILLLSYISIIAEGSIIFIVLFFVIRSLLNPSRTLKLRNYFPDKQITFFFLKHSLPVSISFILIVLINNLGIIFLDFYYGHEKVALYSTAYRITANINEFRNIIVFAVFPLFIKTWNVNKNFSRDIFRLSFLFNCIIFIPLVLIMIYFSKEITIFIYSSKYYESSLLLSLLLIDSIILWLNMFFPAFLNATMNEKVYLQGHILIVFISIFTLLVFLPSYGVKGIVFSRIISDIFSLFFFTLFIQKKLLINLKDIFFRPLIILTPLVIVILYMIFQIRQHMNQFILLLIIIIIILYYIYLMIFKILKIEYMKWDTIKKYLKN